MIFHEVFHSAFHGSPLWYYPENRKWGDAFCDAFRYLMEEIHLQTQTNFIREIKIEVSKLDAQIKTENDRYKGWASRILLRCTLRCTSRYQEFKQLLAERNCDAAKSLTEYFGLA